MNKMNLLINGIPVKGEKFAYEGDYKFYIIEDEQDEKDARKLGYDIYPISEIESVYEDSCDLRFISNWKLDVFYANQFEKAIFIWE